MAADCQLDKSLDATLFIPYTASAREHLEPIRFRADIDNVNRCVGTMLGSQVTRQHPEGLPEGSITVDCDGSGGQSFGAFLPRGVTLNITGDANDYFGKGLSGGILTVRPPETATYKFDENVVVGNVAFYGATSGKGFDDALPACVPRDCQRSGAPWCGGVGNHGCEYMTGGVALILGEVGPNFAAGMSGGVAYVYDKFGTLAANCNLDMVRLCEPSADEIELIRGLIEEHAERTQSPRGIKLLYQFNTLKRHFVKVIPRDYERVMNVVAEPRRQANRAPMRCRSHSMP